MQIYRYLARFFIEKGCKFIGTLRAKGCQFIGTLQDVEKRVLI